VKWLARTVALGCAVAVTWTVPARLASRPADEFFDGDLNAVRALARSTRTWLHRDPATLELGTGSPRFDGEWYLIVHMAAALGLAQTAIEHPELRREHLPLVERALDRILLPRGRAHDREAWGEDAMASLEGDRGHLAFLGYANLALSMHRRLVRSSRFAEANDAITDGLARRFSANPDRLLESYPGETYPADNAVALASVALHDRDGAGGRSALVRRALGAMRRLHVDASSGFLFQRVDSRTGEPRDAARASGTAMAAFALGYSQPTEARRYWRALARHSNDVLGFGGVREYGHAMGSGDVDSGGVLFGLGVSASGFALASARRFGDRARFRSYFASAWLVGLPRERGGALGFASGGPIGDTLLFALLTASRP